jgi:ABC-2 type transport system ATP-binding protein
MDPNQKHEVRNLIQDMSKNKAIIISTHILEEVDAVCTRAIIIAKGKLLFDGTPQELRSKSSNNDIDDAFRNITTGNEGA